MNIESTIVDLKSENDLEDSVKGIDIVFIALHGRGGEDGLVQDYLSKKQVLYTGSDGPSCEIAMNKIETKKIWRELSLPTPDFVEIINAGKSNVETVPHLSSESDIVSLDSSFVVKPAREGSSFGISIIKPGEGNLEDAMQEALKYDNNIIVEAFVEGVEITLPILGDRVLSPISIKPTGNYYDFKAKYQSTGTRYEKMELSKEQLNLLKEFSWHAFSSIGCSGWGRVDVIQDLEGNFQLIEINTVPGMTETSLVPKSAKIEDISFNELVLEILYLACSKS
jgi:D-alanine-D-alanine ligase